MLDDLKLIHERDAQDALGVAEKQWQQLTHLFDVPQMKLNFLHVVFAGMGGSALAALLCRSWPGYPLPLEICRDYAIPAYVGPGTLFIASSYSGNTEETLEALSRAESAGANIAVIAGGGKLAEIARAKKYPFAQLPVIGQPRFAALSSLKALVTILERAGLIDGTVADETIKNASIVLRSALQSWLPTAPTKDNQAKQIALELMGKSVVIYGGPLLFPAAYKWKINMNENAKNVAWCNQLPEFNHNEFIGWSSHPTDKPYAVVDLRSSLEHEQVLKRFDVSDRLLSGKRPAAHVVEAQGGNVLEHMLWAIALGDFVSLYLALLNGLNPTPVDLIEKLKLELQA